MERVLSPEEKLRRAQEIYYRRRTNVGTVRKIDTRVSVNENTNIKLFKKLMLKILICLGIYLIFYLIQNGNYIFSESVIGKTKEILSYDINVANLYNQFNTYVTNFNKEKVEEKQIEEKNIEQETTKPVEETLSVTDTNVEEEVKEDVKPEEVKDTKEDQSSYSQMDIDANYIKENYSVTKPLEGTITSRFGPRNPTTPTVPKYHTGIDIARNEGSVIIAAMEGTVSLVSSEGDYRKPYKNNKWRCYDFICPL